jgi:hypothetical protein
LNRIEALIFRRRDQLGREHIKSFFGHHSTAAGVPLPADIQRYVKVHGLDASVVQLCDNDVRPAVFGDEVRRVDVGVRPPQFQALPQQVTDGAKNSPMNPLVRFVIDQQHPQSVR